MEQLLPFIQPNILFADFYQFTMAQLYFCNGLHARKVRFDYFFRSYPDYGAHKAGYCIFAGLEWLIARIQTVRFENRNLDCLRNCASSIGKALFREDFLAWLISQGGFNSLTIRALPEGRVVHPHEPLITVEGELALVQILESSLLNLINYQTLIATKAARIKEAGNRRPLIEFGMRRAPHTGADAGTRAALIGGADFSSNTGISCALGIPPRGTHAHSMVQAFMAIDKQEIEAFRAYADLYPDDCVLLVDTVNTLESGVPNAIRVFEELRARGHRPAGIRLDSGDLAYLSIRSALMLDKAGFTDTPIVLSNNIDEMVLLQILSQIRDEAPRYGMDPDAIINRLVYGVGTKLIVSEGNGALDGVYKLTAVKAANDTWSEWIPAIKISENPEKTLDPGLKQVWRLYDKSGMATADLVGLSSEDPRASDPLVLHHPVHPNISRILHQENISRIEPLLKDILLEGKLVYDFPPVSQLRQNRIADTDRLDPGVKRLINPHVYHVSLTEQLWKLKQDLVFNRSAGNRI